MKKYKVEDEMSGRRRALANYSMTVLETVLESNLEIHSK